MNDHAEIKNRRNEIARKSKIYFYSGIILLAIGVICLYFSRMGFILIAGGVIMRVLYYINQFDLKAINKLEQRLKIFITLIIPLIVFTSVINSALALAPGDKADELDQLVWVQGEPVKIFDKQEKDKKIFIIAFLATWDKGCVLSMPVLSAMQKKLKKENVVIVGISKEKEQVLKEYLNKNPKNLSFPFAADPSGHISDRYTGTDARIPLVFIVGKDGKILWRGHPLEIEPVLKTIQDGSFDIDKQIKISELHKQLQDFLQTENIRQAIRTADKILSINPSDNIAMRVRLFVFESNNKLDQALNFINTLIDKNPKSSTLYFIKLDLLDRTNATVSEIHKTIKYIFDAFKNKHEIMHQLAWISANRTRFGAIPLETALNASKRSIELLIEEKEQDPAKLSIYLSTQAQIFYLTGALELAIKNQEKVVTLQKGDLTEAASTQLLQYYKNALELRKKEK